MNLKYDLSYCPKLRWPIDVSLQILPMDGPAASSPYAGKEVIIMNCPLGLLAQPLVLMKEIGPALATFDGQKSIGSIASELVGVGATPEIIIQLVDLLDQNYFIENERFTKALASLRQSFSDSKTRPAALAGGAYPPDPDILKGEISGYLNASRSNGTVISGELIGLISPHIDYRRGGLCYGKTYRRLQGQRHEIYILMGTAHQYSELMFHLTLKDFESPLGLVKADKEFIEEVARQYGSERSFQDEYLHKNEHSLELQIPFLQSQNDSACIVPVLVGGLHRVVKSGKTPGDFEYYEAFVESLAKTLSKRLDLGQSVCFLLGVDMAHVGMHFGDQTPLSIEFLKTIEERDKMYLEAIVKHDKRMLFEHIAEDGDARRVCGFPTMYTALDVMERCGMRYRAEIFDYTQAVDYDSDCAVTFAGVGLYAARRTRSEL